ncbi:MAG: septation regulator SpoVG [Spirochaetes bacterium]|nr:septation regulator SpoVG [Spirochaetota bacterium]
MKITEVRIKKVSGEGKLRAYASVTFDDVFVIHNVKVIQGNKGIFVAMPNRRVGTGEYKDVVHPLTTDFRQTLQHSIIDAFGEDDPPVVP